MAFGRHKLGHTLAMGSQITSPIGWPAKLTNKHSCAPTCARRFGHPMAGPLGAPTFDGQQLFTTWEWSFGDKNQCAPHKILHQFHVSNICGCRGTKSSSLGLQPVVVLKSAQKWQLGPSTTFYHLRMRLWEQKPVYFSQNSAPVSCVKHLWCPKLERFCPHVCTCNRL